MTVEEFRLNSKPSHLLKDIAEKIQREEDTKPPTGHITHRDKVWSRLANQVVGAEDPRIFRE